MTSKIELGIFIGFCLICVGLGTVTHAVQEEWAPADSGSVIIEEEDVVSVEPLPDTTEPESAPTPEPVTSPTTTPETTPSPEITSSSIYINDGYETTPGVISLEDYVHYYAGLCPSEQPQNHRAWEHERFVTALGVWSQWLSYQHYIETYWSDWHYSPSSDVRAISSFTNMGFEDNGANRHSIVYIDWSTWTVFWESSNDSPSYSASWDATVAEMQSYLNELESRYRQLCPND